MSFIFNWAFVWLIYAAHADSGFNLIDVNPPRENASSHQKSRYIKSHTMFCRCNIYNFLVPYIVLLKERFPCEVMQYSSLHCLPLSVWCHSKLWYLLWLQLKENGSWICDLDLFHHRPYECLILGYSPGKVRFCNV